MKIRSGQNIYGIYQLPIQQGEPELATRLPRLRPPGIRLRRSRWRTGESNGGQVAGRPPEPCITSYAGESSTEIFSAMMPIEKTSVKELGISGTAVAELLGLIQSSVSKAVERGAKLAMENQLSLDESRKA